ncbi:MAG: PspC domain-containing protein [Candidatus Obscuribacter sp.]|nr:PspC domain-containing protein [Candidatus Obscuribacter sp.]MBK9280671.1 PspC domain-containing protein [Candidatus Obscuribacter sp.]
MLGGVCQGLAYRTGLPVALVRILTVLFALGTAGEVVLLYVLLWATLPRG